MSSQISGIDTGAGNRAHAVRRDEQLAGASKLAAVARSTGHSPSAVRLGDDEVYEGVGDLGHVDNEIVLARY